MDKEPGKQRLRAPSKRSLENRARILDAAETVFAQRGFEGATIRDIAAGAGVPLGLVHHHGGGKEALFREVLARRAQALSALRLAALEQAAAGGGLTLEAILRAFFAPHLERAREDRQWLAYARLVAMVSADPAWKDLSQELFDPTARRFIAAISALHPEAPRESVAEGFVYSVAALLAFLTSQWRIGALSAEASAEGALDHLIAFCAAGVAACLGTPAAAAPGKPPAG